MTIREALKQKRLFFDGAMGTTLQQRGLGPGEQPEPWNLTHPEVIVSVHASYLEAGADILKANTFGANRFHLGSVPYQVEEVVSAGVRIAKEAVLKSGREAYVALDVGPTGKLFAPYGELGFEEAVDAFGEMVEAGEKAGADCVLIETMSDTMEAKAAILAAKEHSSLPVFVTMTFDERGKLLMGADIRTAFTIAEALGADAVGFNCGLGPAQLKTLLPELLEVSSLPMILNPNAGLPVTVNGKTVFTVGPQEFACAMAELVGQGVQLAGGCCGTTPEHIKALKNACAGIPFSLPEKKRITSVASYRKTVVFGESPLVIGERLNPTGKPKLKKALKEGDMGYLFDEALAQEEAGADILDVNVGLPGLDEAAVMKRAVTELQTVATLPLQIDTAKVEAMEPALRHYNGKPLLNSVNGKRESMEQVFPLAKKYGAVVVALTLDEDGIPETARGRLKVAEKILDTAARYGIGKENILVDPLTLTVSAGTDNARITLEALSLIREKLGVHTVLGVSNVSFGLPGRGTLNTAFFTMALQNGLSAGIINPLNDQMTDALAACRALCGKDENCAAFLARFAKDGAVPGQAAQGEGSAAPSLRRAIVDGLKALSYSLARELGEREDPLSVIDRELAPALDEVGRGFERGKVFLPQLLMSAEAAKAAFDALRELLEAKGDTQKKRGKIILATVKGDVHDIGKNIVAALLENYRFEVIDLGRDVEKERILETARRENVSLVGLSALMTTTVGAMEETIVLLHRELPGCKVMVGGAVLTADYAKQIGADYYAKDAMGAVDIAEELFGKG